jgi:hypothetical protein
MGKLFRLEFNEKQQNFHHAYPESNEEPDTFGWVTIAEQCSDEDFWVFESFVNRTERKLTKKYLIQQFSELRVFIKKLTEYNLSIVSGYEKSILENRDTEIRMEIKRMSVALKLANELHDVELERILMQEISKLNKEKSDISGKLGVRTILKL